jgi:DNA-binding HxlR family transcriptional regulator
VSDCRTPAPVCQRYQRAAELLGRRWSAAVLRVALEGPVRFTEIRTAVTGLSARLLAERLRELEAAGLMERRPLPGGAVEYRLTAKGRALGPVIHQIEAWVDDWDPSDASGRKPARPVTIASGARRPPGS